MNTSVLLLSKTSDWCKLAQRFIRKHGSGVLILEGERGDKFPETAKTWQGEYIISFLSPWIIPPEVLLRANKAAINFHPAPPEYPGIGCYNFALYDDAKEYGVTCHHMVEKVDSGAIVKVLRFPLFESDDIASLKERSMAYLLVLFYDIASLIICGHELPISKETWRKRPYTRGELNALCKIKLDMSEDEIHRRVRATYYPGHPGPYLELAGHKFKV